MTEVRERLIECFQAAFPGLLRACIPSATMDSVGEWNSMATLVLASLIEEEFGIVVESQHLASFVSFDRILAWLEGQSGSRG